MYKQNKCLLLAYIYVIALAIVDSIKISYNDLI